jgi:flagella basal body P-ring formation protein FlgA
MRAIRILALGVLAATLPVMAFAAAPQIKPAVLVDGEQITLGDLVDNAGDKAGITVAAAPAPGGQFFFAPNDVVEVAKTHGLTISGALPAEKIVVERASQTIAPSTVTAAIVSALEGQGHQGPFAIDIAGRPAVFRVAPDKAASVEVVSLNFDARTNQFRATLRAPAGDVAAPRIDVAGRAETVVMVPILRGRIAQGQVISAADVERVPVPLSRLDRNALNDEAQIIGMAARRSLEPGRSLAPYDVMRPQVIEKGAMVTMIYERAGLVLTATGRAMQNGAQGELIQVQNLKSNRTVEGLVSGPSEIRIPAKTMPEGSGAGERQAALETRG